ncbi:MAG: DUF1294 domain-containing protein [Acidobacteriota bacterium]
MSREQLRVRGALISAGSIAAFALFFHRLGSKAPDWFVWVYIVASLVTFAAYGLDKRSARRGTWRVAESNLLLLGLVGGWPGGLTAQQLLRHKTRKPSFLWRFWVTVALNLGALAWLGAGAPIPPGPW